MTKEKLILKMATKEKIGFPAAVLEYKRRLSPPKSESCSRVVSMSADRNRNDPVSPQILSGWKEIAGYLGKGVRTVQRYEMELGLPVRRPAGKSYGSVVATKAELDAWVGASPIREAFHLARMATGEVTSTALDIKHTVQEMRDLRGQMAHLRAELRNSLHLLKEGILSIKGELNETQWDEAAAGKTNVLEQTFRTKRILEMLAADVDYKKAS